MKQLYIVLIVIIAANPIVAMDRKNVWVKTTDNTLSCIATTIAQSSNLLKVLNEKYDGSEQRPLIIPPSLSLSADMLDLYCTAHGTKTKNLKLSVDQYYHLIDATEKLKNLKQYVSLIRKVLPYEDKKKGNHNSLSSLITEKWIPTLIRTNAIKTDHTQHTFLRTQNYYNTSNPNLIISNDGNYFIHSIAKEFSIKLSLCNTLSHESEYEFSSTYTTPAYFSPDSNYLIVREIDGTYFYHLKTSHKHLLFSRDTTSCDIVMSHDGKYIINEGRDRIAQSRPVYTIWKVDHFNIPQKISLRDKFPSSYSAIFHPDNEHVFHTLMTLRLYDIVTQEDKVLTSQLNIQEGMSLVHNLRFSPDKTHLVCNTWKNSDSDDGYALINIQNLDHIILEEIPETSIHAKTNLYPLCTAHRHLVTHISDKGKTLQLLDENMKLVTSHTRKKDVYISAIAIDNSGNYLASGYSDGTIILWDLSHTEKKIQGKKLLGSPGMIKKLTFSDNQLLLSQSKCSKSSNINTSSIKDQTSILWDMQGNQVLNLGNGIMQSEISKNGKKLIIINAALDDDNQNKYGRKYVTVSCYNLDVPIKNYTLAQGYTLFEQYNKR